MAMVPSKKYTGVYLNPLLNNDITYYIGYTDATGKWQKIKIGKKSHGITENFANQKRIEYINVANLGEDPMAHRKQKQQILFDTIANDYFVFLKTEGKKDTYNPANRYKLHVKPYLGNKSIISITRNDILAIQNRMLLTLSTATARHIVSLVATIFNFAINSANVRFTGKNPCEGLLHGLKTDNARERYLNKQEVEQLLEAVQGDDEVDMFVRLSLSTGARLISIMNIKAKDIVQHNTTIFDFKNGKTYTGFLSNKLFPDRKFLEGLQPNDYVIGRNIERYSERKIQRRLKVILDALFNVGLNVKDAKNRAVVHSIRHSFASLLVINGTPIYEVMKLMNHSSIDMTMRYAKLAPDSGQNAVNGMF
jgi:integrase